MENAPATERLEAFRNVMGARRLPVPPEYLAYGDHEWTEASAQQAVAELMRVAAPPTAIIAAGDTLALGALRQLRADQYEVGTEIALVSFDDPVSSDLLDPPMTALRRHDRELGEISARTLLNALEVRKSGLAPRTEHPTETRVPLDLIVRRSCGCAPEALGSEPPP